MRVGMATAKSLAQVLGIPVVGMASLDLVAFSYRYARRLICATIDARRREIFHAFYRPVPGGVGKLTIAMLMSNTVKAAKMRRGAALMAKV